MPKDTLTPEQLKVIYELRDNGFAVIIWTPEELKDCPASVVEDRSIEFGCEIIDSY